MSLSPRARRLEFFDRILLMRRVYHARVTDNSLDKRLDYDGMDFPVYTLERIMAHANTLMKQRIIADQDFGERQ